MKKLLGCLLLLILLGGLTTADRVFFPGEKKDLQLDTVAGRYGEPLPWSEVQKLFPRYTVAIIEDLETGKRFEVERRGGIYHADVQPITAQDTKIMAKIFAEGWTWRRRAIVVEAGMHRIAASMNGMPHGSGKIAGNDFKGHFCLHFLGSRVHKSGNVDTAHQMMVWKAAGQPFRPFLEAAPSRVLELVLTALNQGDGELAVLGLKAVADEDLWLINKALLGNLPQVELVSMKKEQGEREGEIPYQIQVKLLFPGQRDKVTRRGQLLLLYDPQAGRWLVEGSGLKKLLSTG